MAHSFLNFSNPKFLTPWLPGEKWNQPIIVFAGRSNVGKSSVINALCNGRFARTSRTPGRTQNINLFQVENTIFADLPGYGYASVARSTRKTWATTVEKFFKTTPILCLVAIIDSRRPLDERDQSLLQFASPETPCFVLLNKCDKLNQSTRQKMMVLAQAATSPQTQTLLFSAKDRTGVASLKTGLNHLYR